MRIFSPCIPACTSELVHKAEMLEEQGKTAMMVSTGGSAVGIVAVADTTKEHSREAVEQLKSLGI